ncbi:hypothetical protein DNL40_14680 [Xylanimonas oleitrophica]|uniref:Uncharacterized protein n=1 Tax=Xylanimonas oleitrophica TaxID=2607479 RepID=A0A2W5WMB1_9MICO|nr:hypothetical protein DNL40_14680 [Xylanimonas oleitrophica]
MCVLAASAASTGEALGGRVLVSAPDDVAELVRRAPAQAEHVVLLAEQRHEREALRQAAALTDVGHHVAVRTLPHGPAALTLIALEASTVASDPGLVPGYVEALGAHTYSGAWLPGVTGLADPSPSLWQHVRSWVPGGKGYVVTLAGSDRAAVEAVARIALSEPSGTRPFARAELLVDRHGVPDAARDALLRVSGALSVGVLPPFDFTPDERFGTPRAVEAVALPQAPRRLLPTPAEAAERCGVCGVLLVGPYCPYCHVRPIRPTELATGGAL